MPRIFDLNLLAIIIGSVVFFFAGFILYGVLFTDLWQEIEGVTAAEVEAAGMGWLLPAFAITVLQVIGIGLLLKWRAVEGIGASVATAATAWLFLAVPLMAYDPIYIPGHSYASLFLDGAHLFVGWVLSAVIYAVIK